MYKRFVCNLKLQNLYKHLIYIQFEFKKCKVECLVAYKFEEL